MRLVVALAVALSAASCAQDKGGICQIEADCGQGLTCNAGTRRCQDKGNVAVDAGLPDAHTPDASPAAPAAAAP